MAKEVKEEKNSKIAALEAAIDHINKQYGAGAVMKLGENTHMTVETISTGSLSLDLALGVGGVPKGRIIEIYGPESGGKTTMALHMVAEVQKTGGVAAFIDAEHALDPSYARNIGVDIDDLYVSQPDCGEQALEITETMVRSGAVDIVVVDSVAALTPKAEIDGDMGDPHVGLQARLMSQALRKLTGVIANTKCTVVFINQLREKSSGKTTVALHCVAEVQKQGGIAGFIDAEHALDPVYAKNIGVDIDNLYISQPDCGEQALEITETMVRSGAVDIVIVDSVAALVPKAEIDGDMGDSHVGLQARLMSQALRKLTGVISKSNCIVIFINQLREKVGVMFGNPETTTGGRALKFYSSVRLDVRRVEQLKQAGEVIGNHTRVKVVKNKVAPPFREAEFDIMFGKGISKEGDILDLAANVGIISKSGAWYAYEGDKIGQGRENAKTYLRENPEFCKMIEEMVREHYFAQEDEAPESEEETPVSADAESKNE